MKDWIATVMTRELKAFGQVDYHRRILTHEGKTVGAMAVGELRP